jgi:hypothetical protein
LFSIYIHNANSASVITHFRLFIRFSTKTRIRSVSLSKWYVFGRYSLSFQGVPCLGGATARSGG